MEKVYYNYPTGWTIKKKTDRSLLRGNSEAIKLFSMRGYPAYPVRTQIIGYSWFKPYVRMPIVTGQFAWAVRHFSSTAAHQRLNKEDPNTSLQIYDHSKSVNKSKFNENIGNFHQWLVGFTDGDGSFTIYRAKEGKWILFFKISQSSYNLRVLYFIKKKLGVGSVNLQSNNNGDFRIRDRKSIGSVIIPIFDKYPLLTSKYYEYLKFRKAYHILNNPNLSTKEKDNLLLDLKSQTVSEGYISPGWGKVNYMVNNTYEAKLVSSSLGIVSKSFNSEQVSHSLVGLESDLNRLPNFNDPSPQTGFADVPLNPELVYPYSHLNAESRYEDITSVITKSWLIGFVEAKGRFRIVSFSLVNQKRGVSHNFVDGKLDSEFKFEFSISLPAVGKGEGDPLGSLPGVPLSLIRRISKLGVTSLGVEQKQDKLLLFFIKRILHIKNVIRTGDQIDGGGYSNSNNFVLSTMNSYAINNIIKQFSNKFLGMNSLMFRIWSRAYLRRDNLTKLEKSYKVLTKLNNKFYT